MTDHSNDWYEGYKQALATVEDWKGNTESLSRLGYHFSRLHIEPGDIVVFSCNESLTPLQVQEVRDRLKQELRKHSDIQIMILSAGADLTALTRAEIEAMAA
jgi:hypothetical protein